MPVQIPIRKPIPRYPDITDESLVGSWLNYRVAGSGKDFSAKGNDGIVVGKPKPLADGGYIFGGSADAIGLSGIIGTITEHLLIKTSSAGTFVFTSGLRVFTGTCFMSAGVIFYRNMANDANIKTINTFNDGAWYDVMISSDLIYVNGDLESTIAGTGISTTAQAIGARFSGGYSFFFDGEIREVDCYSEIKNLNFAREQYKLRIPE